MKKLAAHVLILLAAAICIPFAVMFAVTREQVSSPLPESAPVLSKPEAVPLSFAAGSDDTGLRDMWPDHGTVSPEPPEPVQPEPEPEPDNSFDMIFTGDVLFASSVGTLIQREGLTAPISSGLMQLLAAASLTGVNLEMPFSTRGTPEPDKQYTFRGQPETVELLELMGVDYCALANNHTLDFGVPALLDTIALLNEREIGFSGAGINLEAAARPAEYELGGRKIAILSASRVVPRYSWHATGKSAGVFTTYDPANLLKAIEKAKETADLCIVFVHWGVERNTTPEKYQRVMARQYVDAGADLVIGSHPHVLQGFEYYDGKLIAYSLGNFIFTNSLADTAALQVSVDNDGELSAKLIPCRITKRSTDLMPEKDHQTLYRHLTKISFGAIVDGEGAILPAGQ